MHDFDLTSFFRRLISLEIKKEATLFDGGGLHCVSGVGVSLVTLFNGRGLHCVSGEGGVSLVTLFDVGGLHCVSGISVALA